MSVLNQKTINQNITFNGVGLHSGLEANLIIKPAEPNTGIIFKRTDIKANNIIIPKFSRITNISMIQLEAYGQTFSIEFGGNINTDGSNTNTHDMDMFTTSSADLKAVGQYNLGGAGGAGGLVPAGGGQNCLNVSNSDTLPFTSDKLMTATVDLGAAVTAGESFIVVDYLQAVNATN